jgi:hypothetical protein
MNHKPPVNPLAPVLFALIGVAICGALYWGFGIDKGALTYAVAALVVFGLPVVVIFG